MPRRLHLILGDQLDEDSAIFDEFDPDQDALWMAEVEEETSYVRAHKLRIAFFFAAMRHFRDALEERGFPVHYTAMGTSPSRDRGKSFREVLRKDIRRLKPESLVVVLPGDYRVKADLETMADEVGLPLEIREDRHFYSTPEDFSQWAQARKQLVLEHFYRRLRKRETILIEDGEPVGGQWNFDQDNRDTFGKQGPPEHDPPPPIEPDKVTREVLELVDKRFADHPGELNTFDLPVTRRDARQWLKSFVERRLSHFGTYQDALWEGERFLFHSRLSALLNVKLLNPREVVAAALEAYENGDAPLNAVEGFVRQILGWREFIRGVYWHHMPEYAEHNALGAEAELPHFYWDGDTDMACVADAMRNVLDHGYAHHIQRLMVLGLFAQLWGTHPHHFHEWHMAMYLDAIDWVSMPNTIGMSQWGDGGIVGTKPYCASGQYIKRMSNHCAECRYRPDKAHGEEACPFTTFYWDFLGRHLDQFQDNRRMVFQVRNYEHKAEADLEKIGERASELRERWDFSKADHKPRVRDNPPSIAKV